MFFCGWWWLRSPNYNNSNNAREVNNDGNTGNNNVNNTNNGVVPDLFLFRKEEKSVKHGKHRACVSEAKESLSLLAQREKITDGRRYAAA